MAKRMTRIRTRSVRVSLERLIKQLRQFKRDDPKEFAALAAKVRKGRFRTTNAWFENLGLTLQSMEEWCPNQRGDNPFTIDVPPKSRRRRA